MEKAQEYKYYSTQRPVDIGTFPNGKENPPIRIENYEGRIWVEHDTRLAKMKYDKEHKDSLSKYPELKERMQSLLQNGEKITPKQWKAEIQSLQSEYDSISKEQTKTATELAYAEVISYNKKNLARELQNENRQHNRQQNKTKRREEEI
ncbi:hypothetical protein AALD22_18100 [Lachnospiraceae bacterium 56-18]